MKKTKKILALVAALALTASVFVGCGGDTSSSSSSSSSKADDSSSSSASESSDDSSDVSSDAGNGEIKLKTGGDTFTVMAWTPDDIDVMLPMWKEDTDLGGAETNFVNHGVGGGQAADLYDAYFMSGDDVDLLLVEADWARRYLDNDDVTAPLSDIGLKEEDFSDLYEYTLNVGKDKNGVLKGVAWQACPGGYAYRSDLAEKFLNVKTPEEMQEKVKDWDTFMKTAEELSTASKGATALAATVSGVWQVFSSDRKTPWVEDGKLTVDESATKFISMAKTMRDKKYVTDVSQWNDAWFGLGQTDDIMGYFISTWGVGIILEPATGTKTDPDTKEKTFGPTFGKWNMVVGPQDYYWGGTWMTVYTKTDNADLVKSFIEYFTINKETVKEYALNRPEYMSNKPVMEEIVADGTNKPEIFAGQDHFKVLNDAASKISLDSITPYDSAIRGAFNNAVIDYCDGKLDSEEAVIERFKDDVAAALPDVTVD